MRRYAFVGTEEIRRAASGAPRGTAIRGVGDLAPFASEAVTFVVDDSGVLRVAPRRSEHVACAGGGEVLAAGELTATRDADAVVVSEISNQSTGYCPEPESWAAVARALDEAGIAHPDGYTFEVVFRRCPRCGERNLVKNAWFVCACDHELPADWNF
jgi:hypothetical protein